MSSGEEWRSDAAKRVITNVYNRMRGLPLDTSVDATPANYRQFNGYDVNSAALTGGTQGMAAQHHAAQRCDPAWIRD